MALFDRLTLGSWRQFDTIDIDLSNKVTVLTGANGTGKTSILNLLSSHFGWNLSFAATPYVSKRARKNLFKDVRDDGDQEDLDDQSQFEVGRITYDNGSICRITVPRFVGPNYRVKYVGKAELAGLFIPSHRQQATYSPVASIPTKPIEASQIYENYKNLLSKYYLSGQQSLQNPGIVQKEALISLAVFGEGNSTVAPNDDYTQTFKKFEERLRMVFPSELGFRKLKIVMPEVLLETFSGDFSLDAMSGGVASVFSIVWQIHMFDIGQESYTIVMDEPENHLHPSMQRTLLPDLSYAFPNANFIVATHSPFIVSSFRNSGVFALHHNEQGGIDSQALSDRDLSGGAGTVFRDILGLETTLPLWAENVIEEELKATANLSPQERASRIMSRMRELGISRSLGNGFLE